MAELVHRASRGIGLLLSVSVLGACSGATAPASKAPVHPTAVAACSDALGAGWQIAVEVDRADGSTLALVKGDSIGTCQTWSNSERTDFGVTATGVGLHPTSLPSALSYLTGGGTSTQTSFLVGRVPSSASVVRVTVAEGSQQDAVLGGGLWLAWLVEPAKPTLIEALGSTGAVISRLADPDGVQAAD